MNLFPLLKLEQYNDVHCKHGPHLEQHPPVDGEEVVGGDELAIAHVKEFDANRVHLKPSNVGKMFFLSLEQKLPHFVLSDCSPGLSISLPQFPASNRNSDEFEFIKSSKCSLPCRRIGSSVELHRHLALERQLRLINSPQW